MNTLAEIRVFPRIDKKLRKYARVFYTLARKYACSLKTVLDGKWELKTLMAQILLSEFGGSAP